MPCCKTEAHAAVEDKTNHRRYARARIPQYLQAYTLSGSRNISSSSGSSSSSSSERALRPGIPWKQRPVDHGITRTTG